MIKLVDLLNEIDIVKNSWKPISSDELKALEDDILDLIQNAYGPIGGHPNYKSVSDLAGSDYEVINLDNDPEIDAVTITKKRAGGTKYVGLGHDGSSQGKRGSISRTIDKLGDSGTYIEASGKMADILSKANVTQVTDKNIIKKALKGKEIEMQDDGSYTRYLGGKKYVKLMFGNPIV
tara:strand:- start:14 stop:547 length:534 start_codon:yes stop_codon:yes gene_type:complete